MQNDLFLEKLYNIKPFKQVQSPNTAQAKLCRNQQISSPHRSHHKLQNSFHSQSPQKQKLSQSQIINNITISFDSLFQKIQKVKQQFHSEKSIPKNQKSVDDLSIAKPLQIKKIPSALHLKRMFSFQQEYFHQLPTLTSIKSISQQQYGKQFKKRDSEQKTSDQKNIIPSNNGQMTLQNAARLVNQVDIVVEDLESSKQNSKHFINFNKSQKTQSQQQIFTKQFFGTKKTNKHTSLKTVLSLGNLLDKPQKIKINDFQLGKCLGSGKFGDVYVCKHKKTNTLYALKKIFKSTIMQYKMQQQLIKQLKIHYKLNHPNIIKLYTHFDDQYHIFLLMEYADGGILMDHLSKGQEFVANVLNQMLQAVDYLQKNEIAHRDIKPQNIVICQDGTMKLCDFGWASTFENHMKTTFCGTLDYVSPEMKDKGIYTMSVDIWSLGVLTFELLTGFAPFKKQIASWRLKGGSINSQWKWDISYPSSISYKSENFMRSILKQDPQQRATIRQCLNHPFIRQNLNSNQSLNGLSKLSASQFCQFLQLTQAITQ